MKKSFTLIALVTLFPFITGCMTATTNQVSAMVMQSNDPGMMGDQNAEPTKMGTATAEGYVLFYFGDNSISKAMENGDIDQVHHVDYKTLNILGAYIKKTTIVYGE